MAGKGAMGAMLLAALLAMSSAASWAAPGTQEGGLEASGGGIGRMASRLKIENRIMLDKVEISLKEFQEEGGERLPWENPEKVYPGQVVSKIPVITNLGAPCYLRVRLSFTGTEEQKELWGEECLVGLDLEEWKLVREKGELVCYRREPLGRKETAELFQGVRIPALWGNEMAEMEFGLQLLPEAIQTANFSQELEEESPWGSREIQEYEEGNREEAYAGQEGPFSICCSPLAMELIASPEGLFFLNFNERLPGDMLTGEVEICNKSDRTAELFLRLEGGENKSPEAEILQKEISMKLLLREKTGEERLLYEGPLVPEGGGEEMSLGRFPPGYRGMLRLEAEIPEELGNEFTLTDVVSRWIFWTAEEEPVVWVPKTGDGSGLGLYLGTALLSAGLLAGGLFMRKREGWTG